MAPKDDPAVPASSDPHFCGDFEVEIRTTSWDDDVHDLDDDEDDLDFEADDRHRRLR